MKLVKAQIKALRCLVEVISTDDSYYMHDMAKVEKALTDLS